VKLLQNLYSNFQVKILILIVFAHRPRSISGVVSKNFAYQYGLLI